MMPWSYQVLLVAVVLIAAVFDVRWRRIPNWLVGTGMLLGITLNTFLFGLPGLQSSLLGLALAMLIYFPMFMLRGMGAGDVKLMMAIGSLVGPATWFVIFMFTGIVGGVIAVSTLLWRRRLRVTVFRSLFILGQLTRFKAPYIANQDLDVNSPTAITMPHGATIAAGVVTFLVGSRFFGNA